MSSSTYNMIGSEHACRSESFWDRWTSSSSALSTSLMARRRCCPSNIFIAAGALDVDMQLAHLHRRTDALDVRAKLHRFRRNAQHQGAEHPVVPFR